MSRGDGNRLGSRNINTTDRVLDHLVHSGFRGGLFGKSLRGIGLQVPENPDHKFCGDKNEERYQQNSYQHRPSLIRVRGLRA